MFFFDGKFRFALLASVRHFFSQNEATNEIAPLSVEVNLEFWRIASLCAFYFSVEKSKNSFNQREFLQFCNSWISGNRLRGRGGSDGRRHQAGIHFLFRWRNGAKQLRRVGNYLGRRHIKWKSAFHNDRQAGFDELNYVTGAFFSKNFRCFANTARFRRILASRDQFQGQTRCRFYKCKLRRLISKLKSSFCIFWSPIWLKYYDWTGYTGKLFRQCKVARCGCNMVFATIKDKRDHYIRNATFQCKRCDFKDRIYN